MNYSALVMLACAALALTADTKPPAPQRQGSADRLALPKDRLRKLSSVTWDLESHKLIWTVQKGDRVNGKFVSSSEEQFEISPDQAMMQLSGERRLFDEKEAVQLRRLLDTLSIYCAESVAWWEQGEGTPVEGKEPAEKKPAEAKPVKVGLVGAEAKRFDAETQRHGDKRRENNRELSSPR